MKSTLYRNDHLNIYQTKMGIRVCVFSKMWDVPTMIYFIKETDDFNRNTDYKAMWNDDTQYWQALLHHIREGFITPYRKIKVE